MIKNKIQFSFLCLFITLLLISCSHSKKLVGIPKNGEIISRINIKEKVPSVKINTEDITADELISYAESLEGTKYKYGGTSEETGFDCSGFVWYVFNHFNVKVPRTSVQFTNAGREVKISESKRGDIILFTGSDAESRKVGHMGFITANENSKITFLHAASGGGRGVMKSQMSQYFVERFVKVNRIFNP
jgi:cell wall-associated NlpC family hydrolase